jgi:hypothetical protein
VFRSLKSTLFRGLKFRAVDVLAGGVVPEVDAPDGLGFVGFVVAVCNCFGRVPDVEGVGDECGVLEEDEPLELGPGGGTGVGGGVVGATGAGGIWPVAGVGGALSNGPNCCSLGIHVQFY